MNFFRSRLLAVAAAFALAFAPIGAAAQSQLQDGVTFLGHPVVAGVPPVGTGCTIAAGSTDAAGSCTASATSGSIAFTKAFANAPFCLVTDGSATSTVSMPVYTTTTAQITLTTIISTHVLYWICFGKTGN